MSSDTIKLDGCTAEPLMHYLKSLGVLRLIGEQLEPDACGSWKDGIFEIKGVQGRKQLVNFFIEHYSPSPVITPWNNASGFYKGGPTDLIESFSESSSRRFEPYRSAIEGAKALIERLGIDKNPGSGEKQALIKGIRSNLNEQVVDWVDTLGVLAGEKLSFAPLLGTGGNDGRLEFAVNFMQHLLRVLPLDDKPGPSAIYDNSRAWLLASLFNEGSPELVKASSGQFNPGGVGGPNATQGMEGSPMVNPWDYILMIEGSHLLAGSVACRNGQNSRRKAAFPFTVRPSPAGWNTIAETDIKDARYELWMPLWEKPASYKEVAHLMREGRAQVGKRPAVTGSDFARAAAALGVDRGLDSFSRFAFYKRSGKAYLASPLGRIPVIYRPNIDLLEEADQWLERIRRMSRDDNTPASLKRAYRSAENAIFAFCRRGRPEELQEFLIALSEANTVIGKSKILQNSVAPLQGLSLRWLNAANDKSSEYYLARAAASLYGLPSEKGNLQPIRANLEPVKREQPGRYAWAPDSNTCVWTGENLARNLAAVLARRCLESARLGLTGLAPVGGLYDASLGDVACFIEGKTDDRKLAALLRAFAILRWPYNDTNAHPGKQQPPAPPELHRLYAFCKLFFHHRPLPLGAEQREHAKTVRPYQEMLTKLKQGRGEQALGFAVNKLLAGGLSPLGSGGGRNRRIPAVRAGNETARRTAAALLFPIESLQPLMDLVLRKKYSYETTVTTKED